MHFPPDSSSRSLTIVSDLFILHLVNFHCSSQAHFLFFCFFFSILCLTRCCLCHALRDSLKTFPLFLHRHPAVSPRILTRLWGTEGGMWRATGMQPECRFSCEMAKKLWGPLYNTYHIYTMKYSGSTLPSTHTTIHRVGCSRTKSNMWTYGRLTNSDAVGRQPRKKLEFFLFRFFFSSTFVHHQYLDNTFHCCGGLRTSDGTPPPKQSHQETAPSPHFLLLVCEIYFLALQNQRWQWVMKTIASVFSYEECRVRTYPTPQPSSSSHHPVILTAWVWKLPSSSSKWHANGLLFSPSSGPGSQLSDESSGLWVAAAAADGSV